MKRKIIRSATLLEQIIRSKAHVPKQQGHRLSGGLAREGYGCFEKLQLIATAQGDRITDVRAIALNEFKNDQRIAARAALVR